MFEFDLKSIHSAFNLNLVNKFEKYSFYPAVVRDLTFVFDKSILVNSNIPIFICASLQHRHNFLVTSYHNNLVSLA